MPTFGEQLLGSVECPPSLNVTAEGTRRPSPVRSKLFCPVNAGRSQQVVDFREAYMAACTALSADPCCQVLQMDVLPGESHLRLSVNSRSFGSKGATALAQALEGSGLGLFTAVSLRECFVNDDGCMELCGALSKMPSITAFDLVGANIKAHGCKALAALVASSSTLTRLSLEWNNIGTEAAGLSSLCQSAALSRTLTELDLRNNRIGEEGAVMLASMCKKSRSLQTLDLQWNPLGQTGGEALFAALLENEVIEEMKVTGCDIGFNTCKRITGKLEHNRLRKKVAQDVVPFEKRDVPPLNPQPEKQTEETGVAVASPLEQTCGTSFRPDRDKQPSPHEESALISSMREAHDLVLATERKEIEKLRAELQSRDADREREATRAKEDLERLKREHEVEQNRLREELAVSRREVEQLRIDADRERSLATERLAEAKRATDRERETVERERTELAAMRREVESVRGQTNDAAQRLAQAEADRGRAVDRLADLTEQLRLARDDVGTQKDIAERAERLRLTAEEKRMEQEERTQKKVDREVADALERQRLVDMSKDEQIRDLRAELAQSARTAEEKADLMKQKDRQADAHAAEMERQAERHSRALEALEAQKRTLIDKCSKFETEQSELVQRIHAAEGAARRSADLLSSMSKDMDAVSAEREKAARGHQQDMARLSERATADRAALERQVYMQQQKIDRVEREKRAVEERFTILHEERDREAERMRQHISGLDSYLRSGFPKCFSGRSQY